MALVTVSVHGEILAPDGLTPAVGQVRFRSNTELRDTVANIIYAPDTWIATLDINGEFTITLPTTDNADITPLNWSYQVWVETTAWREQFFTQLPFILGTVEFADLLPEVTGTGSDCTPDGTACAPISILADIAALEADLAALQAELDALELDVAANSAAILVIQGQITVIQGQITALDLAKVNRVGDTMTGDLIISNAYLRQNRTVAAGAAIPSPLIQVDFTTVPLTTDPNILQVSVNGSSADVSGWLNEVGHYRAEQRTNYLFDHNITLIASFAVGTGRLIRFERRDGANVRQITGGIDQDGLLETRLYPFTTITNIDPGATGKYSALVAGGIATISVRREFDDICRLQGRIAVTAAGTVSGDVIMVLPAAFIPTKSRWMSVTSSGGAAIPCEIINGSGNVVARRTQAGAANLGFDDFTYVTS
jgi:hypothetical protein